MNKHRSQVILIEKIYIGGIKHPLLYAKGSFVNGEHKIIVKTDEKTNHINLKKESKNPITFSLNSKIKNNVKKIKIYVLQNGEEQLIMEIKNKLFLRINRKAMYLLAVLGHRIKFVFRLTKNITLLNIKRFNIAIHNLFRGVKIVWTRHHFLVPPEKMVGYLKIFKNRVVNADYHQEFYDFNNQKDYLKWLSKYEKKNEIKKLKYNPLISVLIPVYNIGEKFLSECIDSVLSQSYKNFEICLVDDCSTKQETIDTLNLYAKKDKRIKVMHRETNGHISRATNDALSMAQGEYIALLDNDDLLTKDALYEVVRVLNDNENIDFVYSDEDKVDAKGIRCEPHFKPDYSPDTLMSLNYICHLVVLRKKIVDEVGGFTVGLEGAQDYDLILRFVEKTKNIYHIPKILYHWRKVEGSTSMTIDNKNYALERGKQALNNALKRRNILGEAKIHTDIPYYYIDYHYNEEPKIAIIISTRDHADVLKKCLDSLYKLTKYKNFEVIVVNNNSSQKETFDLLKKYEKNYTNFKVIDANIEFNYSVINNMAVKATDAEYVMLLNNDTEILMPNWLHVMVGYAMQEHVGAVGPKLLYPDKTVQHAGVILGLGGVASHAYINSSRSDYGHFGRMAVPYNYSAVTAACLMISKKKYMEVGGLEEQLKVAYNDVDFNIKLLEKGYYNVFLPQVELIHYESKSRGLDTSGEKYERFMREHDFMYEKWGELLNRDRFYNPNYSLKGWFVLDK